MKQPLRISYDLYDIGLTDQSILAKYWYEAVYLGLIRGFNFFHDIPPSIYILLRRTTIATAPNDIKINAPIAANNFLTHSGNRLSSSLLKSFIRLLYIKLYIKISPISSVRTTNSPGLIVADIPNRINIIMK